MRKFGTFLFLSSLCLVTGCSKNDPILPGTREAVFGGNDLMILNTDIPNAPQNMPEIKTVDCPYTQDSSNIIWSGDKKIFSGFPTNNTVKCAHTPVCNGNFVYAGLTTGEVVKVNPRNREIVWVQDIFRTSNLTGGASVLDIIAPIVIDNGFVYAGGLGDAFCKIQNSNGSKKWCVNIGVSLPFIVADSVALVVATDNHLYAIKTSDGSVYWRSKVKKQYEPVLHDGIITVDKERFHVANGELIKK